MRFAFVAPFILACASSVALGQTGSFVATVTDTGAKLRAGPSEQFPDTATLHVGDPLLVDHEEPNGWLAVQDAPGKLYSVSWVQMQFVNFDKSKPIPQNVTVEADTTLATGQIGVAEPSTYYRRAKIPAGSILTVIGDKVTFEGKSWYPVVPPAGDFRYILKQQIRSDKTGNTSSYTIRESSSSQVVGLPPTGTTTPTNSNIPPQPIATSPVIGGPPVLPAVGTPATGGTVAIPASMSSSPTPGKPIVQNPLWTQAETAEQEGRLDDAEKLYFQLARSMNEPGGDHDIANLCYTRIHSIREKKRASSSNPAPVTPRPVIGSAVQTGNTVQTVSVTVPPTAGSSQSPAADSSRPGYIATGKLARSVLWVDGQRTYWLEGIQPGVAQVYVVPGPGVDLERVINHRVDLYGTSSTRKDLSKPLVVASRVESTDK